jgi:putative copper resistance protein D
MTIARPPSTTRLARSSACARGASGTIIVALLILTGTVNGWFLVGPGNIASLGQSTYSMS